MLQSFKCAKNAKYFCKTAANKGF